MASDRMRAQLDDITAMVYAYAERVDALAVTVEALALDVERSTGVRLIETTHHRCVCGRDDFRSRHALDVHVRRNSGGPGLDHEAVADRRARLHDQARNAAAASLDLHTGKLPGASYLGRSDEASV